MDAVADCLFHLYSLQKLPGLTDAPVLRLVHRCQLLQHVLCHHHALVIAKHPQQLQVLPQLLASVVTIAQSQANWADFRERALRMADLTNHLVEVIEALEIEALDEAEVRRMHDIQDYLISFHHLLSASLSSQLGVQQLHASLPAALDMTAVLAVAGHLPLTQQEAWQHAALLEAYGQIVSNDLPAPSPLCGRGGWRFFAGLDHLGNDLTGPELPMPKACEQGFEHLRRYARLADRCPAAVAFNSIGCLKSALSGRRRTVSDWDKDSDNRLSGLLVRDCSVPEGWMYFPGMQSPGGTQFRLQQPMDIGHLANLAEYHQAVAFDTSAAVKTTLVPVKKLLTNSKCGLYVRIDIDPV